MDYAELFERQCRIMDDLMLPLFKLPAESFTAPGPAGGGKSGGGTPGASLRDILTEWVECQRRVVHGIMKNMPYRPLPAAQTATVMELARAFGGFRLTLRDAMEELTAKDLERRVKWRAPDGERDASLDDVLVHLSLQCARLTGLAAERIRQLGVDVPPVDLLDRKPRPVAGPVPGGEEE